MIDIILNMPQSRLDDYIGMDTYLGGNKSGREHLRQSLLDILTTRRGDRVMRPEYGSRLHELIDRPINASWLLDLYFEVALSIHRWEPRARISRIRAQVKSPENVILEISIQ